MMDQGKKWSSDEDERVAIAWSRATHDPVVGHNQSGDTFDEKVYSLFSCKPPEDVEPGTYNDCSHPSVMTCFQNNISPDVMKFIGVLWMVKGLGLTHVTTEELLCIAFAVYLLKQKGEVLPKSNSAFYLLKAQDPDKWENFKAWKENETMVNVSSTSSYKPSNDSSTSTSIVNVVSQASRPKKQHLSRDAAKVKPQWDKQREQQIKMLSEMHNTMKDSKK